MDAKIIGIANSCKDCPNRHYYSGGAYECLKVRGSRLNEDSSIPTWCPLPNYPAALPSDAAQAPWISVADQMPPSGHTVLAAYLNRAGKSRRIRAQFIAAKTHESNRDDSDLECEYDESADTYYWPAGWYECIDNWSDYTHVMVSEGEITHWTDMPVAPGEPNAAPVAPAAAAPDTADTVFRRCLDLEIQNLTVNGNNEITWMAISCRGVLSSLQSTAGAETEDADRYRWLRTHRLFPSTSTFSNAVELDTAIDAARKVRKPFLDQPTAWVAHDTQAARDVLAERVRQVLVEGGTPMHDDQHADGDLALAASVYAASAGGVSWPDSDPYLWPWAREWWKPTTPRRDLVKAAALIIAEIERIDRAESGNESADAQDGA